MTFNALLVEVRDEGSGMRLRIILQFAKNPLDIDGPSEGVTSRIWLKSSCHSPFLLDILVVPCKSYPLKDMVCSLPLKKYAVLISAQKIWCAHVSLHMHSRMAVLFLFECLVCVCVLVLVLVLVSS